VLLGNGMDNASYGNVPMGISIWNAQDVTIANLSVGNVYFDDIELKGDQGADRITIFNCHLFDSGEQIIKGDLPGEDFKLI
jgi:pectate lyase